MTAYFYALFPDGREPEATIAAVNAAMRSRNTARDGCDYHSPFRLMAYSSPITAWESPGHGIGPDEMLALLRQQDWHFPALLTYRTDEEMRWSHLLLGLRSRGLGEEAAA